MIRHVIRQVMLLGALLAVTAIGCTGVRQPNANVTDATVAERTAEGRRIEFTVNVSNPNDTALPVKAMPYRVTVDGVGEFDMTDRPAVSLPPKGQQTVTVAAAFPDGAQTWSGRRFRITGWLKYQPPGQLRELMTQYRVPLPSVPFKAEGRLEAPTTQPTE